MTESEYVVRILRASNLYEILDVEKTCTNDDLKRSYRKIAVKVHPDRCKDSRATEAFQKVSHAYQVLSDEGKRRNYDLYGDEKAQPQTRYTYEHNGTTRYYTQDDIDAEELFRAFFGGGFGPGTHFTFTQGPFGQDIFGNTQFRRRQARRPQQNDQGGLKSLFISLLPFIILLILSSLSKFIFSPNTVNPLKKELAENIQFPVDSDEELVSDAYNFVMSSYKYGKKFSISKQWRNQMLRYYKSHDFYDRIRRYADEIYEEKLTERCKIEARKGGAKPACVELRKLRTR
jgi:curved DNA-binding protein CbpA